MTGKVLTMAQQKGGAGKTTLLRLLTCEERPTSGKIVVGGIDYVLILDGAAGLDDGGGAGGGYGF